MQCSAVQCTLVQSKTLQCSALPNRAVQCRAVQCRGGPAGHEAPKGNSSHKMRVCPGLRNNVHGPCCIGGRARNPLTHSCWCEEADKTMADHILPYTSIPPACVWHCGSQWVLFVPVSPTTGGACSCFCSDLYLTRFSAFWPSCLPCCLDFCPFITYMVCVWGGGGSTKCLFV